MERFPEYDKRQTEACGDISHFGLFIEQMLTCANKKLTVAWIWKDPGHGAIWLIRTFQRIMQHV